jgi:hypothetical protein
VIARPPPPPLSNLWQRTAAAAFHYKNLPLRNKPRAIFHNVNRSSRISQSPDSQTRVTCPRPRRQAAVARGASLESSSRSACLMPKFLRSAMNGDGASMLCHMFAVADAVNKRGLFAPRSLRVGQNMYSTIHVINTRIEISETYHTRRT